MTNTWPESTSQTDDGYVVAESAFVIPAIVALTVLVMSVVLAAMAAIGLQDTVHSAARDIARGVPSQEVSSFITNAHPDATVTVTPTPQGVTVAVRRDVPLLGVLALSPTIAITKEALVPWETGVAW